MLQIVASLTDNSRGVTYDRNVFTIQATGVDVIKLFSFITDAPGKKALVLGPVS